MATMTGARAAISAQVTSGVAAARTTWLEGQLLGPVRSLGHPHQRLGLDGF